MKVHSDIATFQAKKPVVTIGMFDGVHLGHRALLNQLIQKAKEVNGESVVITFWPHPRMVLNQGGDSLRFLTSLEERTILFGELGVDHLLLLPFTLELANLTSEEFIKQVLVDKLNIHHLLVGYNHRFGKGREHSYEEYEVFAQDQGFGISKVAAVLSGGMSTSSSDIRAHLLNGDIDKANRILGYRYLVTGRVVGGQKLGRRIGFPTANIEVEEPKKLIPLDGVYACKIKVEGRMYGGMLNIGVRPTVNHNVDHRSLEVHIFDFNKDIYSEEIQLEFVQRIRNEKRFNGIDELTAQLKIDEVNARMVIEKSV